jgi:hypothetical protein
MGVQPVIDQRIEQALRSKGPTLRLMSFEPWYCSFLRTARPAKPFWGCWNVLDSICERLIASLRKTL